MRHLKGTLLLIVMFMAVVQVSASEGVSSVKGKLGNLRAVELVIDTGGNGLNDMTEDHIRDVLLVALKSKIPRLRIANDTESESWVHLSINLMSIGSGFAGTATMEMFRSCEVVDTGKTVWAAVWQSGNVFVGPPGAQSRNVSDAVDDLVTKLAADYYRAGNQ